MHARPSCAGGKRTRKKRQSHWEPWVRNIVRHQTNTTVPRDEWVSMAGGMLESMKNGQMELISSRCIYENQDILVQHDLISFPDGTKEAVMVVMHLKDGKIIKTETGATPIK